MARRRRRRRRYGDYVSVPLGLGKLKLPGFKTLNPLGRSVNSTDVLLGALLGLAGGSFVRMGVSKFWPTAPAFVKNNIGPISVVTAGALSMVVLKNKSKATGLFAGAVVAAVAPLGWGYIQKMLPANLKGYGEEYLQASVGYPIDVADQGVGILVDEGEMSGLGAAMLNDAEEEYAFAP